MERKATGAGIALALMLVLMLGATARGAPEEPGSLGVTKTTVQVPVASGTTLDTDIYVPQASGPFPTVVVRHGFGRSKDNWVNWGNHLASRGFVALVPTSRSPLFPDADTDSNDMLAVLTWAVQQSTVSGSPLEGMVDSSRRGVTGHLAGGLAAMVAASKDATLGCAVLFDQVDDISGTGSNTAPNVAVPSISLFAEAGGCNAFSAGVDVFRVIGGPRYGLKVAGSGHCDPEDPSDTTCAITCVGGAQAQYQLLYRRYATAFLEAFLKCDPAAYPYVNGDVAQNDTGIIIYAESNIATPPAACVDSDGGTPQNDASAGTDATAHRDGAAGGDGSVEPDDAGAGDDAGTGHHRSGCGCRASGGSSGALLPLCAGLLAAWRRRGRPGVSRGGRA